MSIAPVDINSLKVDDIKIVSTPQQRKDEEKEPVVDPPKKDEPKAGDPPKKDEPKPGGEPPKKDEPKAGDPPKGDEPPALTDEQITDRLAEIEGKEEADLTDEDKAFLEEYTEEPEEEERDIDWDALSQEVGIDVTSDDEVVEALKELSEYRTLSPALQKAIEIERNKGDVAMYFKSIANDPKDLSDRDALWEQFAAENPKRVAGNPKFARLDFDRKLDKEYELLTQYEKLSASEQEEFLEEHKADLEYLTEKRKFDADAARATLQEKREEAVFKPVAKAGAPEMDEEKMKEVLKNHEAGYKKALAEFDVVSLAFGKDFEFNVGLSEANKKKATEWMKNPETFLGELGFSKGKIDYDTMAGWAALIADIKYGTFGERVRQAILDNKDIGTLEKTLDAPGITKTGGEKPILQGDDWDAIGDAFEKKRMESKKKR